MTGVICAVEWVEKSCRVGLCGGKGGGESGRSELCGEK